MATMLSVASPVGDPDKGSVAHHACARLYADAGVRSERNEAIKSAFLAEERRRMRAESASAKKHSRTPVKTPASTAVRSARQVARNLHLERFSDAFYEYDDGAEFSLEVAAPPNPLCDGGEVAPAKSETECWREVAITNRDDFDAWAAHVRRRFMRLVVTTAKNGGDARPRRPRLLNEDDKRILEENWL